MVDLLALSRRPLKLCPTRVWRTYTGGRLIDEWHGYRTPADSNFPEEWVSSLVTAYNPGSGPQTSEGLSWLEHGGERLYLKDLITWDPVAFLGRRHVNCFGDVTGVLVKILDSAERLAIQVHPDRSIAKRLFRSDYGKTEAWYILGGRTIGSEPPYVLLGFKPGVTRQDWQRLFETQDIPQMVDALHKVHVNPGDVYLVEGGVPHAVGPGCFLVEIQEPTDYTIRTERRTPGGLDLPDELCHQGLGFEAMFDCFHYEGLERSELLARSCLTPTTPRPGKGDLAPTTLLLARSCLTPTTLRAGKGDLAPTTPRPGRGDLAPAAPIASEGGQRQTLISPERTPAFSMDRVEVTSALSVDADRSFSSLIVISGRGRLCYESGLVDITQGDQLFVPHGVSGLVCENAGDAPLVLVQCYPPAGRD